MGSSLSPRAVAPWIGHPQAVLQRVLAGIGRHPNISGYVAIGLGCEVNQIEALRQTHKLDAEAGKRAGLHEHSNDRRRAEDR
jgi:altronate hydrolase